MSLCNHENVDDDISKFGEYALLICQHGHASSFEGADYVANDSAIWKKSLDWSINESMRSSHTNDDELIHISIVAVACGLLRDHETTHPHNLNVDVGQSISWVLSLILISTSNNWNQSCHRGKITQSFLCRLLAHYVCLSTTHEELYSAAFMLTNNLPLPLQLQILTLMAQDWKANLSLRLTWIQLVILPILTTTLTTSVTYLSAIQSSNSNDTHAFADQNLLIVMDDSSEMQHAIDSIICHTLWLRSETFACASFNEKNSYGLTETTVTNLILNLVQQTLRIASCTILQPKKNDHVNLNNTVSFLCNILPHLQECLIEEISVKSISSFQNNMGKMITSFVMDVFYALHTCPIQSILEKYIDDGDDDMKHIMSELYEEVVDFTISLEVALLEKNSQNPIPKQQQESFMWTLLWGLSQSKSLETVLIPAVDILPRLFFSDMPTEIVERAIYILINDYKSILQENSQSDHANYFFESTQNTIFTMSTTYEQWYHIVSCLQYHLNNFVDTFARTGHNDSFFGIVTCLDFTTQIVSARSNIQSDDFQCDGESQLQHNICHLEVVKGTLQKCQPFANVCGYTMIGNVMAKLMNNLGPFIMNGDLNQQNEKVDSLESFFSHKLDLLNYCHELVYAMIPSDLNNYVPNENNLFEQFSQAAKSISQCTDTNCYIHQYDWNQNDQRHPLNALFHIIAKLTVSLRSSRGNNITTVMPSILLLVFTATKYAAATFTETKGREAIKLFCVDYIVPLIESSNNHCFEGQSCVTILIQIFSALMSSNAMIKNDSTIFFLRNLENPLNLALFQCEGKDSDLLTARTTLALLVMQCSNGMMKNGTNTHEKVNINNNVLSKCLSIVNQSMNDLIVNNDGGCIARLAIELKNSIEEVCSDNGSHQLSDNHCAAFLQLLNHLLDLLNREILRFEEVKTLEDELWTVSFVEACLWAGRATFRTEMILHQPQTFSRIIQICLHILGTNHWQICIEGRACKASLDCLKWAFWCCCSFGKTVERRKAINDCMTVSFGNEKTIHQILYILSYGSLGCTYSVKETTFDSQILIRRKLQRVYTSCLYIVLFGDEKSIDFELKKVFRNNDNLLKHCIDQLSASRCDVPSNWVYEGLMNSDKGVHEMWTFILKVRKVIEGEKTPSQPESKS